MSSQRYSTTMSTSSYEGSIFSYINQARSRKNYAALIKHLILTNSAFPSLLFVDEFCPKLIVMFVYFFRDYTDSYVFSVYNEYGRSI